MSKIIKDTKLFYVETNGSGIIESERYSSSGELSVNCEESWAVEIATPFEEKFNNLMLEDKALWIGRIGGSDFTFVRDYFILGGELGSEKHISTNGPANGKNNGYFDFENKSENFKKFVDQYTQSCKSMDDPVFVGGHDLTEAIITRGEDPASCCFGGDFWNKKTYVSYAFVESFMPFMRSFKTWGKDKKILVNSPLSKSVEFQTQESRVNKIHKSVDFPICKFSTYNTPLSFTGNAFDARGTKNWHEMCDLMMNEIKDIEFDIAFLSCGAYSMNLGERIKNELNKKSIYIGGSLNLIFNIYGNRFKDYPQYNTEENKKYRIEALENKEINANAVPEGNCYFGKPQN